MAATITLSLDWDLKERGRVYWTLFFIGILLCFIGGIHLLFDEVSTGRGFFAASATVLIACCLLRLYSSKGEKGLEALFCRLYSLAITVYCLVPNPTLKVKVCKLLFVWLGLLALLKFLSDRGAAEVIRQIGYGFFRHPSQNIFKYCFGCYKRKCFCKNEYGETGYSSWDPFYIALTLFALGHTFGGKIAWTAFLVGAVLYVDSCIRWLYFEDPSSPEAWAWTVCCIFLVFCIY